MSEISFQEWVIAGHGAPVLAAMAAVVLYQKYGEDVRSVPKSEHATLDQLERFFAYATRYYAEKARGQITPPKAH